MGMIWTCQVSCDWTGSGRLQCYGVVDTDVSTPAGGGYLERGQLRCTLEEWVYETGRGPEAMFFKPTTGGEFEVWAWDYLEPEDIPWAECMETSGTRPTTWVPATASPTRASVAAATR